MTPREANADLFAEIAALRDRVASLTRENAELRDALAQGSQREAATSEILRVISNSPTDVQPVFDTIVQNAVRLCGAIHGGGYRFDGEMIHSVANEGYTPEQLRQWQATWPKPVSAPSVACQAIRTRGPLLVRDFAAASELVSELVVTPETRANMRSRGSRSVMAVPMFRHNAVIGAISLAHGDLDAFSDAHVELLKTFADQAVIAIENVRLFKELEARNSALAESLEQQTATAEILQVISSSPTDLDPVLEAIARNAARLCEAPDVAISRAEADGQTFLFSLGPDAAFRGLLFMDRRTVTARAISEGRTIHVPDLLAEQDYDARARVERYGWRTALAVPLIREGVALGTITARRSEVRPFSDQQVKLLETFADQAVIAIGNVRLFKELEARTQELTLSVGQLTALGEVGRAVSSTLDLETVLSTIVSRAIQLSGTDGGSVYEYDEATEEFSLRASRDLPEAYVEQVRDARPRKGEGAVGRVAQTREPVQIADISDPAAYESRVRNTLLQIGLRALLAVPLIAEDQLVGALIVMRRRNGTFAAEEVALLQTFATQSALAIQNARLFREIEVKSRQLEVASQHKSEFLANMSHELRTPLNAIIGFSEVLTDRMFGDLNEKQEEYLKDIHASGTHLLSLINDILDLSKIEAGRMELELTDFDLPMTIDDALTLVRERAARRDIALHMTVDERLGQVQADERKIRQVLLNLLSNAIKFTPEGGRIDVEAKPVKGSIEVSVTDTGVGIAPEDQEAVFEEFRQVGTAEKKVEGTGLGLALSRKFIELHGGKIWVKSEVGVGSTFTFTVRVRRGE